MKGTKRVSLEARDKFIMKKKRLVRSVVAYLKSDRYFFAPLFSNSESRFEALGIDRVIKKKKKRRISERVKEYLKSDCYMYAPMISSMKLKGNLQVTDLVTMQLSTNTAAMREEDKNYMNLRSEIAEQALHNGRINSPKGQPSRETDLSPAFSSLPDEKMVKPDQRRVTIE